MRAAARSPRRQRSPSGSVASTTDGQLDIEFTLNDPKACTRPFTVRVDQRLMADGSDLIEYICHENQLFMKKVKVD